MTTDALRPWSLKALWHRWQHRRTTASLLRELTRIDREEAEERLRRLEADLAVHQRRINGDPDPRP